MQTEDRALVDIYFYTKLLSKLLDAKLNHANSICIHMACTSLLNVFKSLGMRHCGPKPNINCISSKLELNLLKLPQLL